MKIKQKNFEKQKQNETLQLFLKKEINNKLNNTWSASMQWQDLGSSFNRLQIYTTAYQVVGNTWKELLGKVIQTKKNPYLAPKMYLQTR